MRVHTHSETNRRRFIFLTSPFASLPWRYRITLPQMEGKWKENLIKFLLLSRSRADRFITARFVARVLVSLTSLLIHFEGKTQFPPYQLSTSPWQQKSLDRAILLSCVTRTNGESQKCFSVLHKLMESSRLFQFSFLFPARLFTRRQKNKRAKIIQLIHFISQEH
jgi:hypothetical protein